jgi:protein-L-isoaspartate(D-aspartate) O-methyltransferase
MPSLLIQQLRIGGIMVLPVGQTDDVQNLIRVVKTEAGLEFTELAAVRFVPLIEGVAEGPGN